jgi:hypothetical protein
MCFCCIHRGVQKWCQNLCCILVWIHCLDKKGAVILFVLTITAVNITLHITTEFMKISTCYCESLPSTRVNPDILTNWDEFSFSAIHPFKGPVHKIQLCFKICVTEILNHTAAVHRCKFSRFVAFWGNDAHTQTLTLQVASSIFLDISPTQN